MRWVGSFSGEVQYIIYLMFPFTHHRESGFVLELLNGIIINGGAGP